MGLVGIGTGIGNNQLMIVIGLRMVGPGKNGILRHLDGNIHRDRKTATKDGRSNDDPHMAVTRLTAHGTHIERTILPQCFCVRRSQNDHL